MPPELMCDALDDLAADERKQAETVTLILTPTMLIATARQGTRIANVCFQRDAGVTLAKQGPRDLQELCYARIETQVAQDFDTRVGS